MKAKLIRDDMEIAPGVMSADFVGENAVARKVLRNGSMQDVLYWKRGTVLDDPQSFWLVRQGVALPADEECEARASRTPEQLAAAQKAYERVNAGIDPEDAELFDKGVITGYGPDGEYLPGVNFHLLDQPEQ